MTPGPLGRRSAGALLALAVGLVGPACHKKPHRGPVHWGIGVATFDAAALGLAHARTPDPFVDGIRPGRLVIPTYDGLNQATHPDVLLERDPSGAPHLTMAMTPYPLNSPYKVSDDFFENPSLVESRDGMSFTVPPGVRNPLVAPPPYDHNDDPDLRRDPRTGEYEILYLETLRPNRQTLVALRSTDKIRWTRRDAAVYDLAHGAQLILSPAAIDEGGKTYLFYVDQATNVLHTMVSADGRTWDPASATPVKIDLGGVKAWHVDVIRGEGSFGLLISGFTSNVKHQNLYLATSSDLVNWTLRREPLLAYTDPKLGLDSLYRASGLVDHGALVVWYGMLHRQ